MKTPDKKEYAQSATQRQKTEFQSLLDQGMTEEMAWRIVFNEPDSNQPYENWPKAELESLAAKRGIENYETKSKAELIDALSLP